MTAGPGLAHLHSARQEAASKEDEAGGRRGFRARWSRPAGPAAWEHGAVPLTRRRVARIVPGTGWDEFARVF